MDREQNSPKVIFFDAVGTLFGVRGSVGDIYSQIASKYGVIVAGSEINRAFGKSFSQASPLAFGELDSVLIPKKEYEWWYRIVKATFQQLNFLDSFTDFELFFQELYVYFSTKKPWYIYHDVIDCLEKYRQKKVELGIISNFDTRIYNVLELLNLKSYFSTVTISSEVGFAKPDAIIFQIALKKHNCQPEQAWHIGDNLREDYQGANAANIKAFLLERDKQKLQLKNQLPNLNSLG